MKDKSRHTGTEFLEMIGKMHHNIVLVRAPVIVILNSNSYITIEFVTMLYLGN